MSGSHLILLGGSPKKAAVDPYFYSVTSLLHGDGTNGAQNNTFLDSSTNNFTITRNGNTTQGSFSPFSQTGWSNYFSGTDDYLSLASNSAFVFGTGDFTMEAWVFVSSFTAASTIFFGTADANEANCCVVGVNSSKKLRIQNTSTAFITDTVDFPLAQWVHVVAVRSGTTLSLYKNGTRVGTATNSTSFTSNSGPRIGGDTAIADLDGYLSNVRFVKGTAVYDPSQSTLTVPTAPLTAISGTSLLTCQANRFLDASSNAFAITRNGDVSVQPFSPFNPTTAYSTSAVGGSGYFDGSGDYLGTPDQAPLHLGTGDFTVEAWIYPTAFGSNRFIYNHNQSWYELGLLINSSGNVLAGSYKADTTQNFLITSSTTVKLNSWTHVALVRSGSGSNNVVLYLDGVSRGSATYTGTMTNGSANGYFVGAGYGGAAFWLGYIAGFRVIKGSAVYTTAFTPPTAPPTAITNTSLLLNFTNAGIFDNAADADYETVGNAQISTSEKKYGTGSIYLDGTGDWLTTASRPLVALTGDFTVECWIYPTSVATTYQGIYSTTGTSSSDIQIQLNTNQIRLSSYTAEIAKGGSVQANTWTHIAVCRTAGVVKLFQNGTVVASAANPTSWVAGTAVIGNIFGNSYPFTGYIDDFRISNGVARYPYNFTPPTAEFPNIGGTVTLTADPYYDYTTLLLPGNGTNGAQNNTFLDSSTNNFTITRNGNTTQGTFSPFSQTGWGNYFDGTGDYLTTNATQAIPATGDFTIEAWIYPTAGGAGRNIVSQGTSGSTGRLQLNVHTDNRLQLGITSSLVYSIDLVTPNQWNYIAVTRTGTTVSFYINNSAAGQATLSGSVQNTTLTIGSEWSGDPYRWLGYISNLRISNVVRTITAAPTAAFTSDANTVLLTCQSNRFIDNSTNAYTITRNGDVSVQAFSPFNPTAAWSAATNGGSGYFDGSGDYLTAASNAAFDMGSGDFTVEFWLYPTSLSGTQVYVTRANNSSTYPSFEVNLISSTIGLYTSSTGSSYNVSLSSSVALKLNAWNHVAATRNGSTFTIWVNGASGGTATSALSLTANGNSLGIGGYPSGTNTISGYLADVRIVKGTAVYTSAFTPPTAPLTAISGTSLLTNFTNAGIYDATSKNDLETVGNAQISTTQSKFGGSSMYFDGTGDYCLFPVSQNFAFGTGDFTVEFWIKTSATQQSILGLESGTGSYGAIISSGVFYWQNATMSANLMSVSATAITDNNWHHVAITRYNGTSRAFFDGVQVVSAADSTNYSGTTKMNVGYQHTSVGYYNGYIQDIRITKGIARYTSNFTPPTTAFLTL